MSDDPDAALRAYSDLERTFLATYGLDPVERFVKIGPNKRRLRVQQLGSGTPVLFIHGTGGPGAYFAPILQALSGFASFVVDRPGWGWSDTVDYGGRPYRDIVADVVREVLDGLELDQAHLVGASIGNLWALRAAQADPTRVGKVALLGGGPMTREIEVPAFIKLLRSPIGNLIVRVPEKPAMLRKQLTAIGHGPSLRSGRITDAYLGWHVEMSRAMRWARPERTMVKNIITSRGFAEGLVPDETELEQIKQPTFMIYGTADPTGSVEVWERFVQRLPQGELELIEHAGHVVWLDDPARVGARLRSFLSD